MIRTKLIPCVGAAVLLGACATASAAIPATMAASHAGHTVTVKGLVSEVRTGRSGVTYIDLDGRFPRNAFTAVVYSGGAAEADGWYGLKGHTAAVTGTVRMVDGRPEIIATDSEAVHMLPSQDLQIARSR